MEKHTPEEINKLESRKHHVLTLRGSFWLSKQEQEEADLGLLIQDLDTVNGLMRKRKSPVKDMDIVRNIEIPCPS
jgi:hypothetical protein